MPERVLPKIEVKPLDSKCPALGCTNRMNEGGFAFVKIGSVTLTMCMPCARQTEQVILG